MKQTILLFMILITGFTFGQDSQIFKFGPKIESVIVKIDSTKYPKEVIYSKLKDWINYYYHSPKDVLKSDVNNEMIRFDGYKEKGIKVNAPLMSQVEDIRYTIQIDIKDGKYRVTLVSLERFFKDVVRNQYSTQSRWVNALSEVSSCYKNNGDLRSYCKYYPLSFETLMNDILESTKNFITSQNNNSTKNSNW